MTPPAQKQIALHNCRVFAEWFPLAEAVDEMVGALYFDVLPIAQVPISDQQVFFDTVPAQERYCIPLSESLITHLQMILSRDPSMIASSGAIQVVKKMPGSLS